MSFELEALSENKVYSVEQLNTQIRALIEGQLGTVWVRAELSNFKPHTSGHYYFSLKDSKSQISAVMFRGHNSKLKFKPHDGLEVIIRGRVTVYEPRGNYQIMVESMEPVGAGALQKQFEQLKEKLKFEGLFDTSRKKPIPPHPQLVVIVTSPTGAAIQDILNIMNRRAKNVQLIVVASVVQGAAAAPHLCEAFAHAVRLNPDVIIIGRGGGSIEDMWCFNDEKLARAIAASTIPVISAVGHEIDFTICDFVSDLRAPTPSAAAELVARSSEEISHRLLQTNRSLFSLVRKQIESAKQAVQYYGKRLQDPKKKLQDLTLRNDELFDRLENATVNLIYGRKKDVQIFRNRMASPDQVIAKLRARLAQNNIRLKNRLDGQLQRGNFRLTQNMALIDSLSPMKVVDRGFSIAKSKEKVIKSIQNISVGDVIDVRVNDGIISAAVVGVQKIKE